MPVTALSRRKAAVWAGVGGCRGGAGSHCLTTQIYF